ncbi:MAG TPA: hypothetical protein VJY41_07900 [Prolixibacteraceae bacterium]|nr:hypothetical protein [Prolixibacteraceae bacterium]
MSEQIKHECGVAMIRLLKPLEFYTKKYGTWMYGLNKLYLLMEKQHNRGQDGAGIVSLKIDTKPGEEYLDRMRSNKANPIKDIFDQITSNYQLTDEKIPRRIHQPRMGKKTPPFCSRSIFGAFTLRHFRAQLN